MKKANLFKTTTMGFSMLMAALPAFAQTDGGLTSDYEPLPGKELSKETRKIISHQLKDNGIEADYKGIVKNKNHSWWDNFNGSIAVYEAAMRQPDNTVVKAKISYAFEDKNNNNEFEPFESNGLMVEIENRGTNTFIENVGFFHTLPDKKADTRYISNESVMFYQADMNRQYETADEIKVLPEKQAQKIKTSYRLNVLYMLKQTADYLKDFASACNEVTERTSKPYIQTGPVAPVKMRRTVD